MRAKTKNLTIPLQFIWRLTPDIVLELLNVTTIHYFALKWIIIGCLYFYFPPLLCSMLCAALKWLRPKQADADTKYRKNSSARPALDPDSHLSVIFSYQTPLILKQIQMSLRLDPVQKLGLIPPPQFLQVGKIWVRFQSADKNIQRGGFLVVIHKASILIELFCVLEHSCIFHIDAWMWKHCVQKHSRIKETVSVGASTGPAVTYILYRPLGADYPGL